MRYIIEPIEIERPRSWGDIDPATKNLTGTYHGKTKGACKLEDSIVTAENGYTNIELLPPGTSPLEAIRKRQK
jgi:hypothetical protein